MGCVSMRKENLRVIPKKNYATLLIIFVVTIAMVVFAFVLYKQNRSYLNNIPVIRGTLAEIKETDLNNCFIENDSFLLYIGVANDDNSRELEKDLIDTLTRRNLLNTVYLNLTDVTNKGEFYNIFNSNYANNIKLNSYPAFLIINDRKVVDLVQREKGTLKIDDIEKLLDEYEIKGDNNG